MIVFVTFNKKRKEMKLKLTIASVIMFSNISTANDYFVGMNYTSFNTKVSGLNSNIDERDQSVALKFGIQDSDKRVYLQTGKVYDKNSDKVTSTSINYDKLYSSFNQYTPFIGVGISYDKGSAPWDSYPGTNSTSDKGVGYLLRAGTLIKVTKKSDFEIGYVYAKSTIEQSWTDTIGSSTYTFKADDVSYSGPYMGYNYKF